MLEDDKTVSAENQEPSDDVGADTVAADDKSLKNQVSDLVDDARKLALAEIEYYRTKLSVNMAATKTVLMLFGISVALAFSAIIALILGLLLILASYFGPLIATAALTAISLLIAAILMNIAIKRARKLPLDENDL